MQKVIDDIGVHFDAHVAGASTLEGRVSQVADGHGGGADQHDLVFERIRRDLAVNYVHHGILLIGAIGPGVIDECSPVARRMQQMFAELEALQPGLGNVSGDLLVRNLFVLPDGLQGERGKEILVAVTHDQQRMAKRAVGIGIDVNKSIRRCGFRQLRDIGFGPGGDRAAVLDPCLAHVEVSAFF